MENAKMKSGQAHNDIQVEEIVLKVQNGDLKAFTKLYEHYVDRIYRYFFFKTDQESAYDLTETVFLKVWENIKKYKKKDKANFSSWIFTIAHNLLVDHYRDRKEVLELDETEVDHTQDNNPIYLTEQSLTRDNLKIALGKIKSTYREVINLSFMNGLDNLEVARIMKKTEGGLRVLKFRALQELKKVLKEMGMKN
ncbi:sigma-70 family RNA polymerase sigma factor [Candidatus Peregrinibacteria bacterium]|nr:sigma-70 family RNA polymerase sigma factor [Candidatus Peregrinibacteria bacterium]